MRGLLIGQASVMAANGDRVEMEKGHATEFLSRTKLKHTAIRRTVSAVPFLCGLKSFNHTKRNVHF
jgi:hypothetical protein